MKGNSLFHSFSQAPGCAVIELLQILQQVLQSSAGTGMIQGRVGRSKFMTRKGLVALSEVSKHILTFMNLAALNHRGWASYFGHCLGQCLASIQNVQAGYLEVNATILELRQQ